MSAFNKIPNNVLQQSTSFVGREQEISELCRLVKSTRLLTLTGIGGCGKTRLTLKLISNLPSKFGDYKVSVVQLASLQDPDLLSQTLLSAIGGREQSGQAIIETIIEQLQGLNILLVLDNCEHLLAACTFLVEDLLSKCPDLTVLATSREQLGIANEVVWSVPTLTIPHLHGLGARPSAEDLLRYEAVQLFVERAKASRPDFVLTSANAWAVARLCCHLDGIPLALELAAARLRVLTVGQIVERLDNRFKLLVAGPKTSSPRHQTLEALIDWSYDLLTDKEKVLLQRLSVFAGGCTLDSVLAMYGGEIDEYELIDNLTHLIDKSLISMEMEVDEARYCLLETVRAYAMEKLISSGKERLVRGRHMDWYVRLAEQAQAELTGEHQGKWLNRLEMEHDNFRTALLWSTQEECAAPDRAEAALRLSSALWRFWVTRGHLTEGRKWLAKALAVSRNCEFLAIALIRSKALTAAGNVAFEQGDDDQAVAMHSEALAIRRQIGDRKSIAASLTNLGAAARSRHDYKWAEQLYSESLQIFKELNDQQSLAAVLQNYGFMEQCRGEYERASELYRQSLDLLQGLGNISGIIIALNNLGELAQCQRDYAQSSTLLHEAMTLARCLGDKPSCATVLTNLSRLANYRGDYKRALKLCNESLTLCQELGRKEGIARCLEVIACVLTKGHQERSAQLFGAAEALREKISMPLAASERPNYDTAMAKLHASLNQQAFIEKWTKGRGMTVAEIVEFALIEAPPVLHNRHGNSNGNGGHSTPVNGVYIKNIGHHKRAGDDTESPLVEYFVEEGFIEGQSVLTLREREVLQLVARGLSDVQIAANLCLSPRTVHAHLYSMYNKLQVTSRSAAIHYAMQYGML